MKFKISLLLSIFLVPIALRAQAPFPENVGSFTLNTAVTNMAASSTNTVNGVYFAIPNVVKGATVWLSATTYTNTGNVTVYFTSSPNGTLYDTALNSPIKLTLQMTNSSAANGPVTNTINDWFQLSGLTRLRVSRVENNTPTSLTNVNFTLSFPLDSNNQNR